MTFVRRHPLLRRLFLALGCVVWVVAGTATQAHDTLQAHVVCLEHGLIEHRESAGNDVDALERPSIGVDDVEHGEACELQGVPSFAPYVPIAVATLAPPPERPTHEPVIHEAAPRGPPLAYAPKTSPPSAA